MKLPRLLILTTLAALAASFLLWHSLLTAPLPTFKLNRAPLDPTPQFDKYRTTLATAKLLTSRLPDNLHFSGEFEPAVRRLTESPDRPITVFRWNALRAAGVTPQTPVSLDASNQLFPNALDSLLRQAAPSLVFAIEDDTVYISTAADLSTRGAIYPFDISVLRGQDTLDRRGLPSPLAARITSEIAPGTWLDTGQLSQWDVSGGNPRTAWPDTAPGQGFIRYSPGKIYISHNPAVAAAIPPLLRRLTARHNALTFLDETLRLTGTCLVTAFLTHSLLRLRHKRPQLAALLLAHVIAAFLLTARLEILSHAFHPYRLLISVSLMKTLSPLNIPMLLASTLYASTAFYHSALELWLEYLIPLALTFTLLRRRFLRTPTPGLCPACGYDLRASPTLCPECGTPATPASPSTSHTLVP